MKILVVDDEVEVANFLCAFLKRLGLEAKKSFCAKDAMESFNEYNPDWVFLDIKMPDINGLELLKKMKEIKKEINAIMITGKDDDTAREEARSLGASDYLVKPMDLDEMRSVIKKYIPIKE
ncbi:MAG: response regulator [Candidatus Omnitrophica bacterium]|nr:response regulator [Candidatus Omnitrophota bacterium]